MVLAATNFPWEIDEALVRRLEKRIHIPLPDADARRRMFDLNMRTINLADDMDVQVLADKTEVRERSLDFGVFI
jgi:katanin p60 ATPase-containing subunit A1